MKIVIEGAGEVGSHLANMLKSEANDVTVIDDNQQRIDALRAYTDVETVVGNPSSISVLREANVGDADLFIAVYPFAAQEINIVGALLAKRLGTRKVIARISDEDYLSSENKLLFKEMGIELLFYPERSAADEIIDVLKHNSTAETMEFARGKLQIAVYKINEDSAMLDLKLAEFIKPIDPETLKQFRIIAITREDKTIIPKLGTKFQNGDLVFVVSKRDAVGTLNALFGKSNINIGSAMIIGGNATAAMLARSLDRSPHQPQLGSVFHHPLDHLAAVPLPDLEKHVGVALAQQGQDLGQQVLRGHGGGRHRQSPRDGGGGGAHILGRPLAQAQNLGGVPAEHPPGGGEPQFPGGAHHQLGPQLVLQSGYMGADGRLGEIEGLRRLGKAALARHL